MNELQLRIITGSILLIFALLWLFVIPEPWFGMVLVAIGLLATHELLVMIRMPKYSIYLMMAALGWISLLFSLPVSLAIYIVLLAWSLLTLITVRDVNDIPATFTRLAQAQWMMLWLLLFAWSLADMHARDDGLILIAGCCAGVWVSDIAAYFCGKRWGKHKLCPAVSPGKTVEGMAGGLFAGVVSASSIWIFGLDTPVLVALSLAIILVVCGVIGDLNESALKRTVGVKDSGNILPGHGGLLDRIDALLPSFPAIAVLWPLFS